MGYKEDIPVIEVDNVSFTYLGEKEQALKNINLTINQGDFVLVLGPSSSGKTSLINLFNGSIPSIFEGELEGSVTVEGLDTKIVPISELAKKVGMVFQDPESQLVNVLVKDEIYFGPENIMMPIEEIVANAKEAIELVGAENLVEEEVFNLSGGQKQKVSLASVLSMKPQIITLDQPTANLDPKTRLEVFNVLGKLNKEFGMTVVVIEHEVDDLARFINKVVIMEDGGIHTVGKPREVFSRSYDGSSKELGLWIPQISEMANKMRDKINFPTFPMTVDEAANGVEKYIKEYGTENLQYTKHKKTQETDNSIPLIEVKNVDFIYEVNQKQALTNVSLNVHSGDFLAILGKNGSGKSTLAKVLMKINKVDRGKVFIKGKDINDISIYELTKTVGYVFQSPDHQFIADTVYDEVAYSLRVRGLPENTVKEKVYEVLELFKLEDCVDLSPFSLSMGQRRLLSVATMLVLDQEVVILDEPTIGQDQVSSNLLMGYLNRLNKDGKVIIIISHDMRLISKWVERTFVMSDSKVLYDGSVYHVFGDSDLLEEAALLPPPLAVLMQRLRKKGLDVPSSIFTTDQFEDLFNNKFIDRGDSNGTSISV